MTVAYWIVAAVLALFYLYAGGIKVVRSKDQLRPMMGWIDIVPLSLDRAIGILEVFGALGLILPPLTGIATGSPSWRLSGSSWYRSAGSLFTSAGAK